MIGPEMIRLARPSDAAAIAGCVRQAYAPYVERIGREPAPMTADYADLIARGLVYVLGDPVGEGVRGSLVLRLDDRTLWIDNVAVHPEHQRRGLGRCMLDFAETRAGAAGLPEVALYTNELMVENIALYQRLGYVELERRAHEGFRRVFMHKSVSERRVQIRPDRPGDGAALAGVWLDGAAYYAQLDPRWFQVPEPPGLSEWFDERLGSARGEDHLHHVAELRGEVVGFVSAILQEPLDSASRQIVRHVGWRRVVVNALVVHSAFWRLGIGHQLLQSAEDWGRGRGARLVVLDTFADSPVSVPFYEHGMGYQRHSIVFSKQLS
jgi:GNAT superfamily N-acetyltransferase